MSIEPTNGEDGRGRKRRTRGQKVVVGLGIGIGVLAATFGLFALLVSIFFVIVLSNGGLFPNK